MRVLVTGNIAGLNDKEYINGIIEYGKSQNFNIDYYDLVDELEKTKDKKLAKMLGTTNYIFQLLREREYRKIGFKLQESNSRNAIIRVPATIQWNGINYKFKDHKEIINYIRPDVVVTLIDAEWNIKKNIQNADKTENMFLKEIKKQNPSYHDILSWMNEEVSLAEDWAEHLNVRHYVVPIGLDNKSLFNLVKYKDLPSFYVSYSMTHSDKEARKEVDTVISKLSEYGLVIDPQAIEINSSMHSEEDMKVIYSYTVHRDLHWFVGKVDAVVAIHPYVQRPPLSTGMMDELGHARDYHKRRYMIFPPAKHSPFTTDSYIEKGHIFQNSYDFFLTLESEGFSPLKERKD